MICPRCGEKIQWRTDFTCEEVFACTCDEGIVSYWDCPNCESEIQVKSFCKEL